MPRATPEQCRRYRQKLKKRALDLLGDTCVFCKSQENIEAAHVKPTAISGRNARGMSKRHKDIINNPDCYRPMCTKCHRTFDRLIALGKTIVEEEIPF